MTGGGWGRHTSLSLANTSDTRLLDLLAETARELVDRLDATASSISRAIGDVLIQVTEYAPDGRTLLMGTGYLVPDYPLTQIVLASREPRAMTLADPDVDPAEARVLRNLEFASLLMLPLEIGGRAWGLVEVYRAEPLPFTAGDMRVATEILARTSARAG